jgi:L-fuculose-phosphate aldolase
MIDYDKFTSIFERFVMSIELKRELKKLVLESTYRFFDMGLSTSKDSGDVSLRDPETDLIYIDPRPNKNFKIGSWRSITIDDIVVIDMNGKVVDGGITKDKNPTVEWPMHIAIYKARPETYGIVHSHALYSGVFAALGWDIPSVLVESALAVGGDKVVCAEYGKVSSKILGENIVKALGKRNKAALLRQHGSVYIGSSIDEALTVAEYTEKCAQTVILGWSMNGRFPHLDTSPEGLFDESIIDIIDEI